MTFERVSERIDACYDSHVHWAATGEFSERIRLESLGAVKEILSLPRKTHSSRQNWIFGFGWDDSKWPDRGDLHRKILDQWTSEQPVLFTRVDGHVGWVNTLALKQAGWIDENGKLKVEVPQGGRIDVDEKGSPTGILIDKAYEKFLETVPKSSPGDIRRYLMKATQIFHAEGFTHIRDVGGSPVQWEQALLLDRTQVLNLAVEMFFHLGDLNSLSSLTEFAAKAKAEPASNLRAKGIKIFLDGALGSEGAWISRPYASGSGHGLQLMTAQEIEDVFRAVWEKNLEVALHVIGDAAIHEAIQITRRLKEKGVVGRLHLEHAEIIRPETLEGMKGLDVICHLQPCHWLSDHKWLKEKVGEELYAWSFPWRRLQQAEIAFDFGSDTPIEPPNVARTVQALQESATQGIPKLLGNPERFMSHPDRSWAPNSFSIFENGRAVQVVFRGDHLL